MASSDYIRGEMEIAPQEGAYKGFMAGTVYGGVAIIVMLLYPILVFAVKLPWLTSLGLAVALGLILGIALKLKAGWYAGLIASAVPLAIISALIAALWG